MDQKKALYWLITAPEIGYLCYESTILVNSNYPTSEVVNVMRLACFAIIGNTLLRGIYKYPTKALFVALPLFALTAYEFPKYVFDTFTMNDFHMMLGMTISTVFVNLLNRD